MVTNHVEYSCHNKIKEKLVLCYVTKYTKLKVQVLAGLVTGSGEC
jgi:hypothetical protein